MNRREMAGCEVESESRKKKVFRLEKFEFVWGNGKEVSGEGTIDCMWKWGWRENLSELGQSRIENTGEQFHNGYQATSWGSSSILIHGSKQAGCLYYWSEWDFYLSSHPLIICSSQVLNHQVESFMKKCSLL